jgi:hypothetical protein
MVRSADLWRDGNQLDPSDQVSGIKMGRAGYIEGMQPSITKAEGLSYRPTTRASNDDMSKGEQDDSIRSHRRVPHKGVMWRHPRNPVSMATNFPRFKACGSWPVVSWRRDANALVVNAVPSLGD